MHPPLTYKGAAGLNLFKEDRLAQTLLRKLLPPDQREGALSRLSRFGALCGGRLAELVEAAHKDDKLPRLVRRDKRGRRVDQIEYCPEQIKARRLAMSAGILPPVPLLERMTKAYLLNQLGEGGITCPLAMTDGLITLLEKHGTEEQGKRYLPLLRDADGPTPLTAGQFVTEQQGGSNVSENETRAEQAADGSWRLTGLKWFCSNPGELWVTTAKPKGSNNVALFLMPRRMPDGKLNECRILRLKDISGTRGKATAEVEYKGAYAELVGRASQGMALLLRTVLRTSRIHVAAASLGMMRRACLEASLYCRQRVVLGKPVSTFPAAAAELAALEAATTACTLAFYEMLRRVEEEDPLAEALIPLLKIGVSRLATDAVRRARLLFAGSGALRDFSVLPRLAEDALIQEIWEGTHPILAGHALKALRRPASRAAFESLLAEGGGAVEGLPEARRKLKEALDGLAGLQAGEAEAQALPIAGLAFHALLLALTARHAGTPLRAVSGREWRRTRRRGSRGRS